MCMCEGPKTCAMFYLGAEKVPVQVQVGHEQSMGSATHMQVRAKRRISGSHAGMNTVGGGGTLNDDADFPRGLESFELMLYYRGQELGAAKVWSQ